jgi:hypothetical protein
MIHKSSSLRLNDIAAAISDSLLEATLAARAAVLPQDCPALAHLPIGFFRKLIFG